MNEDHIVAKLSIGWKPNESVSLADLNLFDSQTQGSIRELPTMLFETCQSLSENRNILVVALSRRVNGV